MRANYFKKKPGLLYRVPVQALQVPGALVSFLPTKVLEEYHLVAKALVYSPMVKVLVHYYRTIQVLFCPQTTKALDFSRTFKALASCPTIKALEHSPTARV